MKDAYYILMGSYDLRQLSQFCDLCQLASTAQGLLITLKPLNP